MCGVQKAPRRGDRERSPVFRLGPGPATLQSRAMAQVVLVAAALLAFAALGGRAQTPGCWNEQMADKQRLQYGLMMVRQQIANMLTVEYIAGVSAQMGSPLGVSGASPFMMAGPPRSLHEHQTLVLPASGGVGGGAAMGNSGHTLVLPASGGAGTGAGARHGYGSHVKSTTYKKEVPLKDGY
ncbi:hypothetical protein HPB50_010095 [Hyalomma asiaticum]|uniref:Uncharacterized protein n=1 Tax=Hyalomma asiaticum TaxID=266040 RepID=A0ACB7RR92_HYAAI|nr:hypothetical protein HPB50_010095 [Hyalomma asiaticum]